MPETGAASPVGYFGKARISRAAAVAGALRPMPLETQVSALFGLMSFALCSIENAVEAGKVPASVYSRDSWEAFMAAARLQGAVMELPVNVRDAVNAMSILGYRLCSLGGRMARDGLVANVAAKTCVTGGRAAYAYARQSNLVPELRECCPSLIRTSYLSESAEAVMAIAVRSVISGLPAGKHGQGDW